MCLSIFFRVWSPTLKSSAWERSRFLLMWWRWRVRMWKTHKVTLIVPCRKIKDLCIICVHLSRGHHSICVGAQRQQVCRSPRRGSQNQRLLLSCEKQRQDRAHKWVDSTDVPTLVLKLLLHSPLNVTHCPFFYRDVWQAAGQQHLLEPPGTVFGAGWTQEVS